MKQALLNLLSNRYEDNIQNEYKKVCEEFSLLNNPSETLKAHMIKLNDLMENYTESNAYDLRNLISYNMIPIL